MLAAVAVAVAASHGHRICACVAALLLFIVHRFRGDHDAGLRLAPVLSAAMLKSISGPRRCCCFCWPPLTVLGLLCLVGERIGLVEDRATACLFDAPLSSPRSRPPPPPPAPNRRDVLPVLEDDADADDAEDEDDELLPPPPSPPATPPPPFDSAFPPRSLSSRRRPNAIDGTTVVALDPFER